MKKQTGIFGGSFNPVHLGHLALAKEIRRQAQLDEVWMMVSPQNPLKRRDDLLDDALRLELMEKAVAHEEGLTASDYEFHLPRPSYTWDTLEHLRHDYPNRHFSLIIGADNWQEFARWYRADDITRRYPLWIYPRPDYPLDEASLPAKAQVVEAPLMDISSTDIRRRVAEGLSVSGMVPESIVSLVEQWYQTNAKQ